MGENVNVNKQAENIKLVKKVQRLEKVIKKYQKFFNDIDLRLNNLEDPRNKK